MTAMRVGGRWPSRGDAATSPPSSLALRSDSRLGPVGWAEKAIIRIVKKDGKRVGLHKVGKQEGGRWARSIKRLPVALPLGSTTER